VHAPCRDKSGDVKDSFYEELARVFDQFPRYDMKILLGDFNAKVDREDIFKPTIGNQSTHEITNDNGVSVVNFATYKNLVVKSTMFPHRSIHKYTWTSPDGQMHNQINHVLIDSRLYSSILHVRSFRGTDCDTDHYLVVARIRERLAVGKRSVNKMDMDRFNVKNLIEGDIKEEYQVTIKNRFLALQNLEDNGDINRAWDAIRENINISAKECIGHSEAKRHKPWFDECLKLVDRRKQAKLQRLKNPSEVNEDNLSNVDISGTRKGNI
jgi:hypothetical protein